MLGLCAVTNRQILVYPLVWVEEERPAVDVLGFGIGRCVAETEAFDLVLFVTSAFV